ncbi:hypothetical protein [Streptomyces sp. Midd1]|uniref:hypothetical protein n=1 Tax=Streptomyces sp. Midd3 TaxID=3161191 RepID=UPI0034DB0062
MAWDDSASPYPGYDLCFVIGENPLVGQDVHLFVRFDGSHTGIWNDAMIRDLIEGMVARGYRLRGAELSKKTFPDQYGEVQIVELENNVFPMPEHWLFAGWQ